jgi:chromosomal replication initiator protein
MEQWSSIYEELCRTHDGSLNSAILSKIQFQELRNDDTIVLVAPDPLTQGWFNENYLASAADAARRLLGRDYRFEVRIAPTQRSFDKVAEKTAERTAKKIAERTDAGQLNPRYTFDRFIVGPNNDFAQAAALQVATNPGKSYNPLFLYGSVALGKTHLLQAVAHKILQERPELSVYYTSSENFTNEFVECIKNREMPKFRKKYRSFDVLIIDDIQFMQQKESTVEELFHTFNELFHSKKQLIFACDRPAKSLSAIEDRLRTRFDSGLSIKIEAPNYETRKAILLARAIEEKMYIPDEVIDYIAQNVDGDIRLLEGSLTKVLAYGSLKKKDVSLDLAKEILRDKIRMEMPKNITISEIQRVVSKYFNITVNDLKSKRRVENITYPRQIAMYLAKEYTNLSLNEIGNMFGDKAHTTVMRSAEKVEKLVKSKKKTKKEIEDIIADFYNVKKEVEAR